MPYGEKAGFLHKRQKNPDLFEKGTFETVPLSHANYEGKKFAKWNKSGSGAKAIVGMLKKTGRWGTQSILIPKKKKK